MNTPFLDRVYAQIDFDRNLVLKFFTIFSLFEYALKRAGFRPPAGKILEADWEKFAKTIHDNFDPSKSTELQQAVNYLLSFPTKKQIFDGADVVFVDTGIVNHRTIWLATLINRTRNNLFHGGKFRFERPRDIQLLESSLIILEDWARLHPDVEQALEEAQ